MNNMKKELLRTIPKIDEVLMDKRLSVFFDTISRDVIVESVREAIDELRKRILVGEEPEGVGNLQEGVMDQIIKSIAEKNQKSLRRTINATGIALHTNLGRAKLSKSACESVNEIAKNYSTLEYDVKKGARGSRHDHLGALITKITGAEAAMVVNNNAAATMLCLAALTKNKEVIVSRGELVEIGGSFRVPEIMAESGACLVEVGATNKTKLADYEKAITPETGALLKVHTSNYKIMGFTAEVTLPQLVELGKEKNLPVIYDMGSGLMVNLRDYGIDEPTVIESLATGIDLILFSGDKLLGGPQGGILAGKKEYIDQMKKHPLARVLRVDKMTLAAMEATFRSYLDLTKAQEEIPVLHMLTLSKEELKKRAEDFASKLKDSLDGDEQKNSDGFTVKVEKSEGQVGGGSAPTTVLPGYAVTLGVDEKSTEFSLEKIERALRNFEIPIIVRIFHDKIHFDMRTISDEEGILIVKAVSELIKNK
ncbi:MAG: L-seryl-tRNA(Sec) selenium transferase [Anaerovorax sp.]